MFRFVKFIYLSYIYLWKLRIEVIDCRNDYFFFNFVYSVNDNYDKEKEEYYGFIINFNGNIGWFYLIIFKSFCIIDVIYFFFDD